MRIEIRMAKTIKCKMLPKATGKIYLKITHMHTHFLLCLLESENFEFRVWCALLTQSNVDGNSQVR